MYLRGVGSRWPSVLSHSPRRSPGGSVFRRSAHQGGIAERKAMIDREHDLPVSKQAEVLRISRGSCTLPRPVAEADLAIMRRLDRLGGPFPSGLFPRAT